MTRRAKIGTVVVALAVLGLAALLALVAISGDTVMSQ